MPLKPCPECGQPTPNPHCPSHTRPKTTDRYAWQQTRTAILTAWRQQHGNWCPGLNDHAAHQTTELTVDHITPRNEGGTDHPTNLRVICQKANAARR